MVQLSTLYTDPERRNAQRHRRTDRRQYNANSRSAKDAYCFKGIIIAYTHSVALYLYVTEPTAHANLNKKDSYYTML